MSTNFYCPNDYAAKWYATDLYPEVEKELRNLVDSNEPFMADALNCQKEICGWFMSRETENGPISVTVWAGMDEGYDLVEDAILDNNYNESYELLYELLSDDYDEIINLFYNLNCSSEALETVLLPGTSNLDDILKQVDSLYYEAQKKLDDYFEVMKEIVKNKIDEKEKN